jgi:hypothetical protein
MVSLNFLGIPEPSRAAPVDYADFLTLGDGSERGAGCLQTTWRFDYLEPEWVTALRAYCAGSSASVYLRTLAKDGAYKTYSGLMIWTEPQQPKIDLLTDVVIKFRNLIEVA